MALLDPDKTWAAIRESLPSSVSSSLNRQTINRYDDPVYGYTPIHARGFSPITASAEDINAGLAIVAEAMQPADNKTLLAELGTLKLMTISRGNNDDEMALVLRAYARELGRYPRDIVLAAIHKHARTQKWWPALAELLTPIEEMAADRVDLRDALESATPWRGQEIEVDPDAQHNAAVVQLPTEEQKAAVSELMSTEFGEERSIERRERVPPQEVAEALKRAVEGLRSFRLPREDDPVVQDWLRQCS